MSSTSWSGIRSSIATRVETVSGTVAARQPISVNNVPATLGTIPYSILIESANQLDEDKRSRNRPGRPARVQTAVTVTIARKLQVDAQVASYDTALDNAQDVIQACVLPTAAGLLATHVFFDAMTASLAATGEWVVISVRFLVQHQLSLTA